MSALRLHSKRERGKKRESSKTGDRMSGYLPGNSSGSYSKRPQGLLSSLPLTFAHPWAKGTGSVPKKPCIFNKRYWASQLLPVAPNLQAAHREEGGLVGRRAPRDPELSEACRELLYMLRARSLALMRKSTNDRSSVTDTGLSLGEWVFPSNGK